MQYVCDSNAMDSGLCTEDLYGTYLLAPNATSLARSTITTQAIHIANNDRPALNYGIRRTGYYCVATARLGTSTTLPLPNSEMPTASFPARRLPSCHSTVHCNQLHHGHHRLPGCGDADDLGYYDYQNRHGANTGSRVMMIIVSILNAARNSFSFFLLLIVCMGYGVVKPSLGKRMLIVRWLAIAHFVFGVIYAIASLTVAPEDAGPVILLVVLPLAGTLTAFYVWTLNSLAATMKDLRERKQKVKAAMYNKLWWCILGSVLVIFAFFFFNSLTFAGATDPSFTPTHWQTRWFILDGWLNIVYLADVAFIAYVWRPTVNNRRFAMSDEVLYHLLPCDRDILTHATDQPRRRRLRGRVRALVHVRRRGCAERGTITSANGSTTSRPDPPAYAAGITVPPEAKIEPAQIDRTITPLPAPIPRRPSQGALSTRPLRESMDGETIFAVGEDGDKFSDEEGDDEERKGLTRKDG
ncbi:hypothetical protein MRB53_040225 [Persea americana]|nr:hypothetical protein MRB53_040225 [Persea americana]